MISRSWTLALLLFVALYGGITLDSPCNAQEPFRAELKPSLVLGDASGVAFGTGLRLAVDSQGRIYVGDPMNSEIRIFSPTGELVSTVGGRGQGPGEFRSIHGVVVARGDSLYVYDASQFRLSVYAPGARPELAYTLSVTGPDGVGHPYQIFVPSNAGRGLLAAFRNQGEGTVAVYRLNDEGAVRGNPLFRHRASESKRTVRRTGGGVEVVRTAPLFAREALIGLTPRDEFYYAWTEEVNLTFYDLNGRRRGQYATNAPRVPVTARDIAYELEGSSETRRRLLRDAEHPSTKPAMRSVLVDDRGGIWVGRYTTDPETIEWTVTRDRGAGGWATIELPEEVDIQIVRGNQAYATALDEWGAPTVVRYTIRSSPATSQGR